MTCWIRVPLVNANEDVVTLVDWVKASGDRVGKGETLAVLETTKSTAELPAETSGFLVPLVDPGAEVAVGEVVAAITERAGEEVGQPPAAADAPTPTEPGRGWTKKAEILAARHGIDIAAIAERVDRSVTERDVEEYHASRPGSRRSPLPTDVRDHLDDLYPHNRVQRLLVIGAGRGAVQILDVLTRDPRQRAVGLLDENPAMTGKTVMGCPVLGSTSDAHRLWEEELFDAAVISISTSIEARVRIFDACTAAGIRFANIVDPSALVLSNATLGAGNVILALCHIGAATTIGDNNFMSARTHLEHHNTVASHNTFGPCVVTSSRVEIGSRSRLGTGIFVEPGILIGDDSVVASGAVLTRNVPPATVVKVRTTTQLRSTTDD